MRYGRAVGQLEKHANTRTISVQGRSIEVGEEGFLVDLDDWDTDVAAYFARLEGITMTDLQWEIVTYLRDYYKRYQIAPMIKILAKEIGRNHGPEKGTTQYLCQLYPAGPARQACKIAGLPGPTGCV